MPHPRGEKMLGIFKAVSSTGGHKLALSQDQVTNTGHSAGHAVSIASTGLCHSTTKAAIADT